MEVYGDVGRGKQGVLSEKQVLALVLSLDKRRAEQEVKNHYKTAINKLLTEDESTASGGGNKKYPYDGLPLYHESFGAKESEGASIFYVKRRNGEAEIVGLGYHTGAQTYKLTWKKGDWMSKLKQLTFDNGKAGNKGPQINPQNVPKGGFRVRK